MAKQNQKKLVHLLPHNYPATVQALYKKAYGKDISRATIYKVAKEERNNVLIMNILVQLAEEHKIVTERMNKSLSKLLKPRKNAKKK